MFLIKHYREYNLLGVKPGLL